MFSQSKLVVLKSLCKFLSIALSSRSFGDNGPSGSLAQSTPSGFFESSFRSRTAFETFDQLIRPVLTIQGDGTCGPRHWSEDYDVAGTAEMSVNAPGVNWAVDRLESQISLTDMSKVDQLLDEAECSSGSASVSEYIAVSNGAFHMLPTTSDQSIANSTHAATNADIYLLGLCTDSFLSEHRTPRY